MSATITWSIQWMQCKATEGSYADVVVTAGWLCQGAQTEGSGNAAVTYNGSSYGSASFPMPEGTFTPYDQLTQTQVLGWCWANGVDQTAVEAGVQSQIDGYINPPIVQLPLPWATPTV